MIAEMLLKTLGAERRGAGTAAAGAAEVGAFLHDAELDGDPTRLTSNFINGITHLPLRWPPAAGGNLA